MIKWKNFFVKLPEKSHFRENRKKLWKFDKVEMLTFNNFLMVENS